MTDEHKLDELRNRLKEQTEAFEKELSEEDSGGTWHSVAKQGGDTKVLFDDDLQFVGKNLESGKFANEDLKGANFSVANLSGVDFSGADLRGVDFSGANLTGANLSGADLTGAVFSGAVLQNTNFAKAKMHGVKLTDADLENAILVDVDIDAAGLEELQAVIEYLAKYYPHKLSLKNISLKGIRLANIDLSKLDLRGVDFTGVDFTGVNIVGLDLSECIITPQQIAQALGRVPGPEELARIMAPKKKNKANYKGVDFTELFLGSGKEFGVWDFQKDKGVSIETLLKMGKKVFGKADKPEVKDKEALDNAKSEQEKQSNSHNEELRRIIEERKQKELAARKAMKDSLETEKQKNKDTKRRIIPFRSGRGR